MAVLQKGVPIQYTVDDSIGSGSSGKVYKGKLKKQKLLNSISRDSNAIQFTEVAIKVVPHVSRYQNEVTQFLFLSEKLALNKLKNTPNIINCLGQYQDKQNSYFAMEYLKEGTLKDYLSRKGTLSEFEAIHFLFKMLEGLKKIQQENFVHRDIKPENIMLKKVDQQKYFEPLIIDFGFCQHNFLLQKPSMFYNVGSPSYMSPQSYNCTQYSSKSDLWSMGIIFYEMLIGQSLDTDFDIQEFFGNIDDSVRTKIFAAGEKITKNCKQILTFILNPNQTLRPSVQEALSFVSKRKQPVQQNQPNQAYPCRYQFKLLKKQSQNKKEQNRLSLNIQTNRNKQLVKPIRFDQSIGYKCKQNESSNVCQNDLTQKFKLAKNSKFESQLLKRLQENVNTLDTCQSLSNSNVGKVGTHQSFCFDQSQLEPTKADVNVKSSKYFDFKQLTKKIRQRKLSDFFSDYKHQKQHQQQNIKKDFKDDQNTQFQLKSPLKQQTYSFLTNSSSVKNLPSNCFDHSPQDSCQSSGRASYQSYYKKNKYQIPIPGSFNHIADQPNQIQKHQNQSSRF